MKIVSHYAKKYTIAALNGNITYNASNVPVYGDIPSTANAPYITIYTVSQSDIDQNDSDYSFDADLRLEVVTSFGRGIQDSSVSEQIMSSALELLMPTPQSVLDMSADSLVNYRIELLGSNVVKEEYPDKIYVRYIADIGYSIQEA